MGNTIKYFARFPLACLRCKGEDVEWASKRREREREIGGGGGKDTRQKRLRVCHVRRGDDSSARLKVCCLFCERAEGWLEGNRYVRKLRYIVPCRGRAS